jgi:hypothetical protein
MGNTLTVANLAAANLTHVSPVQPEGTSKPYVHKTLEGEPPPECPMHKPKVQPQVSLKSLTLAAQYTLHAK